MIFALLTQAALAASCADDTIDELERSMQAVLDAHKRVDELAFDSSAKLMDAAIICLDAPPPPGTLGRLHHVMALRSFVNGQTRATKRALAALRLTDPRWESPFPPSHPFTELWADATDPGPVEPIGDIDPKAWVIDAIERNDIPIERGFLLQVRDENGDIQLNRYLYDPLEVPDMGQNRTLDVNATYYTTSVRVLGLGRFHGQRQLVEAGTALDAQQASAFGGGGTLQLRVTPSAILGAEASLSVLPGDDLVGEGAMGVEGHVVALVGSGIAAVGERALFVAGRIGLATDTSRAWPRSSGGVITIDEQVIGPSIGLETGLRSRNQVVDLHVDAALAGATVPWLFQAQAGFTHLFNETIGLRVGAGLRSTSQPLLEGEVVAGRAGATDARGTLGADIVF
jgi:hypothetical protein